MWERRDAGSSDGIVDGGSSDAGREGRRDSGNSTSDDAGSPDPTSDRNAEDTDNRDGESNSNSEAQRGGHSGSGSEGPANPNITILEGGSRTLSDPKHPWFPVLNFSSIASYAWQTVHEVSAQAMEDLREMMRYSHFSLPDFLTPCSAQVTLQTPMIIDRIIYFNRGQCHFNGDQAVSFS